MIGLLGASVICQLRAVPSAAQQAPALSPFAAAKARAVMRDRLPCVGCHDLDGNGNGGRVGPDLRRVRERRDAAYIARMIDDPEGTVPGTSMPRTPMSSDVRALVIAYLSGSSPSRVPPRSLSQATSGGEARLPGRDAAALYGQYCAACHGARGGGDGPNARHLRVPPAVHRDSVLMSTRTDDRLFDAIFAGGHPLGRSAAMPAFGATLSRVEIWSLVRYLRVLCRCRAPAWSTDGEPPTRLRRSDR